MSAGADAYYVSPSGSDTNSGTSTDAPWQTVARVNAVPLNAGDSVSFEGGQTLSGNLVISSESGAPGMPITITSYGSGNATIWAASGDAVEINKSAYVTVTKLTVSGPGWNLGTLTDDSRGVNLDGGSNNCVVSYVIAQGFHKAGIASDRSGHDNLLLNDSAIKNGYTGIWVQGTNQQILKCSADYNYGDLTVTNNWSGSGIFVSSGSYVTIEDCEASQNGSGQPYRGNGPVGIWCWDSDHVYIGHCISHDNKRGRATADGDGFDFDGGTTDSTLEYCYSYNNVGVGYLLYNLSYQNIQNSGNTIRFSVSANDAVAMWFGSTGAALSNDLYLDNVFILTNGRSLTQYKDGTYGGVTLNENVWIRGRPVLIRNEPLESNHTSKKHEKMVEKRDHKREEMKKKREEKRKKEAPCQRR
jgi:hypothetical protein